MSAPLLTFDNSYVYTYEIIDNVPKRPITLRVANISGFIADRQVASEVNLSHVGVILGVDESEAAAPFPSNIYICALDNSGINISTLEHFSSNFPVKIIKPNPYDLTGILKRLQLLTIDNIPTYNIITSNCQTFVGNMVYGPGASCPNPLLLIMFVAIVALFVFTTKKIVSNKK